MFRALTTLAVLIATNYVAGQVCKGGAMAKTEVDTILKFINDRRVSLLKGEQKNGPGTADSSTNGTKLPAASDMAKIDWNCELESKAATALGSTCVSKAPNAPKTNAAFFAAYDDATFYTVDYLFNQWTSQIDVNAISASSITTTEVKYDNVAIRDYANLVRSSTTAIGCVEKRCTTEEKYVLYCLTDQPELASGDVIYKVGSGGCESDTDCNKGKCETSTGLCIPPATTSTSTTTTTTTTTTTKSTTTTTRPAAFPVVDSSQNRRCPSNTAMTDPLRYKFLDMHNYRRELLAKGNVNMKNMQFLPKAANMRKMRYNCALEVKAAVYIRTCPKGASPESARAGAGENFIRIPQTGIADYTAAVHKAVTSWWKVVRTTNGIGMDVMFNRNYINTPVSSFTQMAWATTHKIGCAVAKCFTDYVAICRYEPRGNNAQQAVYTKGNPCTMCPDRAWCTNNALCTLP